MLNVSTDYMPAPERAGRIESVARTRRAVPVASRLSTLFVGLLVVVSLAAPTLGQVEGRAFFKDGSPCVLCRLEARVGDEWLRVRADLDGYFQIQVENPDRIRNLRSDHGKAKIEIEDGFVFLRLDRINPQLEEVVKAVRQQLQFVSAGLQSSAEQSMELTDCFLAIHSVGYFQGQALHVRLTDVDLTELMSIRACPDRDGCIQFQPALVNGRPPAEGGFARIGVVDKPKKQDIPALLQAIQLLARACGNVKVGF